LVGVEKVFFYKKRLLLTNHANYREATGIEVSMIVSSGRQSRSVCFVAFLCLLLTGLPAQAIDLEGSVSVRLTHGNRVVYRTGLIIGDIPSPVNWGVALLPSDALYTADLDYITSLENVAGGDGQVLDVPTINVESAPSDLNSLSIIGLSRSPSVGVAACMAGVEPDQQVRIATTSPGGELQSIPGRITQLSGNRKQLRLDSTSLMPKIGDPIYVAARRHPLWRVLGVVRSVHSANNIEILTLPEIFDRLPKEAGGWALQPLGLCDAREKDPQPALSYELKKLTRSSLQAMLDPEKTNMAETLQIMRKEWPSIRSYLSRPGIEHYFFNPALSDDSRFLQFWQSIVAVSQNQAQLHSPLAAVGPIARIRSRLPGRPTDRGWALAVAYLEKRTLSGRWKTGGYSNLIVLLTAYHLVQPGTQGEREIKVYFPMLQGVGVEAMRMPVADLSRDLAVIVLEMPKAFREQLFSQYQTACSDSLEGSVEVPINAWGWRRDRLPGSVEYGAREGELLVKGVDVTQGFSGGALLKNGNQFAGILTKDLGAGRGSLAVSIDTALNLFNFGTAGIKRSFCYPPRNLEERIGYSFVRSALMRNGGLVPPDRNLLARLFVPGEASRIDTATLPSMQDLWSEKLDFSGLDKDAITDFLNSYEQQILVELASQQFANIRCSVLVGQNLEPASQEFLNRTAPLGPDGRPTISQEDTIGCDLRQTVASYPKPRLSAGLNVPICVVRGIRGLGVFVDDQLWDATFLKQCKGLKLRWYVPQGWVRRVAAKAPLAPELVHIPAGSFRMGGCLEDIIRDAVPGLRWFYKCRQDRSAITFRASTAAYRIQRYPVTVAEYALCVLQGHCHYDEPEPDFSRANKSPCNWGRPGRAYHPMNCISWDNANEYCQASGGLLPTEAEWEKAARGTDARHYPWSRSDAQSPLVGYIHQNRSYNLRGANTMAVGLAPELKSPFGVEDMGWHIREWTSDLYEPYEAGWTGRELLGEAYSQTRVQRGVGGTTFERKARHINIEPDSETGFRCVFH
jgi:formylglycine-generating enzyme required for sulfatase activity